MISTRNDELFPLASIEKLYAKANEPKDLLWTETTHVRSKKRDLVVALLEQVESHLIAVERRSRFPDAPDGDDTAPGGGEPSGTGSGTP